MKEENIGKIGNFDPDSYKQPAQLPAKLSLIFGVISVATVIFDGIGVFPGIIGIVLALVADQRGNDSNIRKVGLVVSIIGTIMCILVLLSLSYLTACYDMLQTAETLETLILR